ncbi:Sel1-like repeat-containing protein kinase family protein [Candidatus Uabimicrobium amorphum]|uniref:Protein kinase domain-containing protein n=1 Tax=Uabimicrobium amorphum TaxID=2596890 RepID=A0A5S9IMA4_UABAM|nr:Sel1-like repeat-containing protein kinase family protein [Candidatus Uabimicrobium amorphum]BBM84137.1 hypothetical protein UABAM_02493 [Candidatus Uabimicrobium amorphum]
MEKYKILQQITDNTSGKLFLAENRTNNQKVFLKTVALPRENTAYWVEQHKKNGYLLSQVQHPNVIRSCDFFINNHHAITALEYMQGIPFAQFIPSVTRYSFCEQVEMAMQIVSAITTVNEYGVVHQNISPDSFIVRQNDRRIKLIDAGIVAYQIPKGYLSPERLQRKAAPNSDVYSLGALLYVFFGYALYPQENFLGKMYHTNHLPPLAPTSHQENFQRLSQLLQHTLEANPAQRLQNALQLKNELKEIYKAASSNTAKISKTIKKRLSAPIEPRKDDEEEFVKAKVARAKKKSRRKLMGILLVLLVSVVLISMQLYSSQQKHEQNKKAFSYFQEARQLFQQERYSDARKQNQKALAIVEKPLFLIQKALIVFECRKNNEDVSLANELARKARPTLEKLNSAFAIHSLGMMYTHGIGVLEDRNRALNYYNLAMKRQYIPSFLEAGTILEKQKKYLEAAKVYQRAIKLKSPEAFERLALLHLHKRLTTNNIVNAEVWLKKGASLGSGRAMNGLAYFYFNTYSGAQDINESMSWLRKAVKYGDLTAYYNLGKFHLQGVFVEQDTQKGLKYLEYAAENGHANATFELGEAYFIGKKVEKDHRRALVYFRQAAFKNSVEAVGRLGDFYHYGYGGVAEDHSLAFEYYTKSAEKNNMLATHQLGLMYYYGRGVKKDLNKMIPYFTKAAQLGYAESMYTLGLMTEKGIVRAQATDNRTVAIYWYKQAAAKGDVRSKEALIRLQAK